MEADPSVMALCRELLAAAVLVLVRRVWGWCVAYGRLESADRCVLSAVNGTNRGKSYSYVQSRTCNTYSVEVHVIKGIKWNETGVLR